MKYVALLFVLLNIAAAQTSPSNQADTSGICSPVVQANQGKVQITCKTAMDEATRKKFLKLLNQILNNTKDTSATNKKLDDILEYVSHLQATNSNVSAPNGIAIGGNNLGNPTVNNFGPPTRTLDDGQITDLANIASRIPDSQTVDILTANTKESDDYGTAIQQALGKNATTPQLKSGPVTALAPFSKPAPTGTVICVQNFDSPTMPLAKEIGNVLLRNAVVRVMISPCSGVQNNEVRIIIAEP